MPARNNPNLIILELAVGALDSLADEMVFLGGCATGLLITDTAAPIIRATKDVDVITEVASLVDYHRLSEQLRGLGFAEDQSEEAQFVLNSSSRIIACVGVKLCDTTLQYPVRYFFSYSSANSGSISRELWSTRTM